MPLGHIPILAIAKIHIKNGKASFCKSFLVECPMYGSWRDWADGV